MTEGEGKNTRVILISGLSGSGKTTAIKALEDIGFYCVDNLPVVFLPGFMELCERSGGRISKVALVEDIRGDVAPLIFGEAKDPGGKDFSEAARDGVGTGFSKDPGRIIQDLKREGYRVEILFLESSDQVLMRRFSETRRRHPLALEGPIRDGLRLERKRLQGVRDMADQVIDTSKLSVHLLREKVQDFAQEGRCSNRMRVVLLSFGYSFGIPFETDLLMDVRFLPNPYFVDELRRFRGDDPNVAEYVLKWDVTREFLRRFVDMIRFLLPLYQKEMKTHLTISVGCTGGRHRSVAVVNRLAELLREELTAGEISLTVQHRDVDQG